MVAAIVFVIPVGIISVYMMLGVPNLPDNPLANRADELSKVADSKQFSDMADKLLARLEKNPDDAAGWGMLGRTYRVIARPADSAKAYSRAYALSPDDPIVAIDYGEALVIAEKGHVTEAARMAFEKALALDPRNLKGLYFLGVAKAQTDGQLPEAIRIWEGIVKDAPPDAPWLTDLRNLIARAKESMGKESSANNPSVKTQGG
jgi:cytochrome c-type biogenesis protein CcmH